MWKSWSENKKFWFIRILSYKYSKNYYFYFSIDELLATIKPLLNEDENDEIYNEK